LEITGKVASLKLDKEVTVTSAQLWLEKSSAEDSDLWSGIFEGDVKIFDLNAKATAVFTLEDGLQTANLVLDGQKDNVRLHFEVYYDFRLCADVGNNIVNIGKGQFTYTPKDGSGAATKVALDVRHYACGQVQGKYLEIIGEVASLKLAKEVTVTSARLELEKASAEDSDLWSGVFEGDVEIFDLNAKATAEFTLEDGLEKANLVVDGQKDNFNLHFVVDYDFRLCTDMGNNIVNTGTGELTYTPKDGSGAATKVALDVKHYACGQVQARQRQLATVISSSLYHYHHHHYCAWG
jgi:hypothetical protein